jgi:hypothetical protein
MPIVGQFGSLAGFGVFPGGAFESIATVTVGSGGAANIEFTSIPSTYQHLQIRWIGRCTDAGVQRCRMRFNSDSTAANYSVHLIEGSGSGVIAAAVANYGKAIGSATSKSSDLSSTFVANVVDILDYASTTKNKTVRSLSGQDLNGGDGVIDLWSSGWFSTSAVSSISLFWDAGNFAQHSTAALYGVKAP